MGRRRDPNLVSQHLCRFCGERIPWGTILRVIRVDPDTPGYVLQESACHTECLARVIRPGIELTFPRHWPGSSPFPDDSADINGQPCAICAKEITPERLVRLRIQKLVGPVKQPTFDEQSLPVHFECLAKVSTSRFF